jgi:NADPH-dependent 2,4-dienoyl-CoA reductase/sulfur reductase-like enzyme
MKDIDKPADLTRRGFLGAAAVAGLGALAACSSTAPAAGSGSSSNAAAVGLPAKWDQETEIVIVGIGSAGVAAAVEASKLGISSIIIDKMPEETAGGDSTCFGGAFSVYPAEMLQFFSLGAFSAEAAETRAAAGEEMMELVTSWGVKINEMGMVEGGALEFDKLIKAGLL